MSDGADRCPRCGGGFRCGVNDVEPCACTTVTLDARTLADLRASYDDCLCLRCLVDLSELAAAKEKAGPV
ncbi:MAG: cysteine-rich CWC family protein [Burkholderiales bacterium]